MKNKFFNDAIIGNNNMVASFSKTGELLRLFYPTADYRQFFEEFNVGIKVNQEKFIYLNDEHSNKYASQYSQRYIENTNVVETNINVSNFKLQVKQTNFIPIDKDVLIYQLEFKNVDDFSNDLKLFINPKAIGSINNDTCGYIKNDCLFQYNHDYSVCIFSNEKMSSSQLEGIDNNFTKGKIKDSNYIGMSNSSSICYDLGSIKPNKIRRFVLFIHINENSKKDLLTVLEDEVDTYKSLNITEELKKVIDYWRNYVTNHDKLEINKSRLSRDIKRIYNRSILLFAILTNHNTGAVSAGIEVDERKLNCGRYGFCWPRDAVFITKAFDILNMKEDTEKFYKTFCDMTQSKTGMWEQRFFTDGNLAPNWGYQVDETASVIYGAYHHYKRTNEKEFLLDVFPMCERAITFLKGYTKDMINDKNSYIKSYDLWEEYQGYSCYSIATIYMAFHSMIKIYQSLINDFYDIEKINKTELSGKIKELESLNKKIKNYILNSFYDKEKESFVRNIDDRKMDISLLGLVYPCGVYKANDELIENTIKRTNAILKTISGGYLRYEDDNYIGGKNSWPVATLWMSIYYLILGERKKCMQCFKQVIDTACTTGLLGEQIDEKTLKPCWVIGLTWSHAMFVVALEKLLLYKWL